MHGNLSWILSVNSVFGNLYPHGPILVFFFFAGEVQEDTGTWRERLQKWKEILQKEKLAEQLDSANSKYVVEFDMKEVENSLRKDVVEKVTETQGTRALWIAKRWWLYRPKLPYTYFLQKLDCSEVMRHYPLFYLSMFYSLYIDPWVTCYLVLH